jgi:hypothetical protein
VSRPREPRLAHLLLRVLVRGPDAEFLLGDLAEDFQRVHAEWGAGRARGWYRRQALSTAAAWVRGGSRNTGETWRREIRLAVRSLRRSPAYSVTSVLTFSIALGGVCIVAALAYSILRPLPYPDSERLVAVWETRDGEDRRVAPANYLDWRRSAESFVGLAAHDTRAVSVTVEEVATRDRVAVVSGNFFDVLGVRAVKGRTFDPGLDTRFPERVAVLSHRAWSEAFAADPRVLGRTFLVEDRSYEVVGVMPDGLAFPDADLFAWLRSSTEAPGIAGFGGDVTTMRDAWYFEVVGRLAPESDAYAAGAEMDALTTRLAELHPDTNRGHGARVIPLLAQSVAGAGPILLGLSLAVVIMLLAGCLNVTHLTLARSDARAREVAIKRSLGATRGDVERQVLVEASILSLAGGAVGLIVAIVALTHGADLLEVLPRRAEVAVRPGVAALTMLSALAVGTAVALATWRLGFSQERTWLRGLGGARGARSVRDDLAGARSLPGGMVALQVAGAIALLCVTGLMARSVHALASVDPGFEPEDLLTFRVALPDAPTRTYAERVSIYESVAREVRGLPGVGAVGLGSDSPLATGLRAGVFLDGDRNVDDPPSAGWQPVDAEYFEAFGRAAPSPRRTWQEPPTSRSRTKPSRVWSGRRDRPSEPASRWGWTDTTARSPSWASWRTRARAAPRLPRFPSCIGHSRRPIAFRRLHSWSRCGRRARAGLASPLSARRCAGRSRACRSTRRPRAMISRDPSGGHRRCSSPRSARSRRPPCSWRWSASTESRPMRWADGAVRSASAWHSAPSPGA